MALVLTSAPECEPVTVAEAKAHLRVDGDTEDALIASLILTSRLHVETALGLALLTQSWRFSLDAWPASRSVELPLFPLRTLDEVRVRDEAGAATVIGTGTYVPDIASRAPRLVRKGPLPVPGLPVNGIEIDFTAGYGDEPGDVPAPIREALLLLVAHWYEHRDPIEVGAADAAVPGAVSALLAPYKRVRL